MKSNALLGAVLGLVLACTAARAQSDDSVKCGNDTLKGSYGFQFTGIRPAQFVPVGKPGVVGQLEQVDGSTLRVFDGKGSFTQAETSKGTTTGYVPARPGRGVYAVAADCSVEFTVLIAPGVTAVLRGLVVDGGKEIRGFAASPEEASIRFVGRQMK